MTDKTGRGGGYLYMLGGGCEERQNGQRKCEKTQEWTAESEIGRLAGSLVQIYMEVVKSGDKYKASGCSGWQWVERRTPWSFVLVTTLHNLHVYLY